MEKEHINDLIKIIAHKKKERFYFNLKDIKQIAKDIRNDGYLISNKTNKDQIDDPFLNSPYFDFIAEVWDYTKPLTLGSPLNDILELADYLVDIVGFDVKKNKG